MGLCGGSLYFLAMSSCHNTLVGVSTKVEPCALCNALHMDYYPHNYMVFLDVGCGEVSVMGWVKDDFLSSIFFYECPHICQAIQRVVGHDALFPLGKNIIFPSQILSVFSSNSLDLL